MQHLGDAVEQGVAFQPECVRCGAESARVVTLDVLNAHAPDGDRLVWTCQSGKVVWLDAPDRQQEPALDDPSVHPHAGHLRLRTRVVRVVPGRLLDVQTTAVECRLLERAALLKGKAVNTRCDERAKTRWALQHTGRHRRLDDQPVQGSESRARLSRAMRIVHHEQNRLTGSFSRL